MGGEDGAVTGGRELVLHPFEDLGHRFLVDDGRSGGPYLQRIRPSSTVIVIEPEQDRGRVRRIVLILFGQVAENQEDVIIPAFSGKISFLELVDVVADVAAQGVEAGLVQEHHLAGLSAIGAHGQVQVEPVPLAGAEQQRQERQEYEPDFLHKNRYIGQS